MNIVSSKFYIIMLSISLVINGWLAYRLLAARKIILFTRWPRLTEKIKPFSQLALGALDSMRVQIVHTTSTMQNYFARLDYGLLFSGIAAYLVIVVLSIWLNLNFFQWVDSPTPGLLKDIIQWTPIWVGAGLLIGGWIVAKSTYWSPRYWQLVSAVFTMYILYGMTQNRFTPQFYGDTGSLESFIQSAWPYPSWLIGNSILEWTISILWQFPPFVQSLPLQLQTIPGFVMSASAIAIGLGSIILLQFWPNRLWVLFPILTPFWILFGHGYSEYYPFLLGPLTALAAYIFSKPLKDHSPTVIGLSAVGLAFYYNTFIPMAVLLLFLYFMVRPRETGKTIGVALAGGLLILTVCWPGSIPDYFVRLYINMNWGEINTMWPRFAGKSAGPDSIFFSTQYALSAEHFKDVVHFHLWGEAFVFLFLMLAGIVWAVWQYRTQGETFPKLDARLALALGFLAFGAYYVTFMIPKLGPARDVDLFSFVYTLIAFFAGFLWDILLRGKSYAQTANFFLTSVALGGSMASLVFLIKIALPSF